MRPRATPLRAMTVVAALAVAVGCCDGGDDAGAARGDETSTEAGAAAGTADFCADLEQAVETGTDLFSALVAGDSPRLRNAMDAYPGHLDAAMASAPPGLADDIEVVAEAADRMLAATETVDVTDSEAVFAAVLAADPGPELDAAVEQLDESARTDCGFDPDADDGPGDDPAAGDLPEAGEPPDPCTFVDPAVPVAAAGVAVEVTEVDGGSSFDLGSIATRSCTFGSDGDVMVLSTITYAGPVEEAHDQFVANVEANDGAQLDVDVASLAPSTLVTEVSGVVSVTVLRAPVPFTVAFLSEDEPTAAIAAAEAIVAAT